MRQATLLGLVASCLAFAQEGEWTGVIHTEIQHPAAGPPRYRYSVRTTAGGVDLELLAGTVSVPKSGSVARVRGERTARGVTVREIEALASPTDSSCPTTGERKIAALMVIFPGIPKPDLDPNALRQMLFGTTGSSLNTYWRDASHGKTSATGDVFGWIEMDRQYDCLYRDILVKDVWAAAAKKQIDLTKYDHVILYFQDQCGILGQGGICGNTSEILVDGALEPNYYHLMVTAHELGDQLGPQGVIHVANCSLDLASSSIRKAGNEAWVTAALTFSTAFGGDKTTVAFAYTKAKLVGPTARLGAWTVGPALPAISGVVNAASFAGGAIAPGELISIFGTGLGNLPKVLVNELPASVVSASAAQINAIVPDGISGTSAAVGVEFEGRSSAAVTVSVAATAPGVFDVFVNQDGSFNSEALPAVRGSIISLFATGAGPTVSAANVQVTFGGVPGEIRFAGMIYPGVLQVNVVVPAGAPSGSGVPVKLSVGDGVSPEVTVTLK